MIDKIKRDKDYNWKKAINFIPKENEVIIYDCLDNVRIKIGDGKTKVNDLKFAEEEIMSISNIDKIENEVLFVK